MGQKGELEGLEERAKASGASKLYIEDLTDEFVEDYVIPTMQAGADYEGYLLGTSFARPILAKRVVEIARAEGADAVCHGSTGKHRHRYEFNNNYRTLMQEKGLVLSGLSPDGHIVETVEIPENDFYIGVQYHPEFKSRPNKAHPLFKGLISAALRHTERG